MVWRRTPADQGFSEAGDRIDDDLIAPCVDGVGGEQHAGGARIDHLLHDDVHSKLALAALFVSVRDRARIPERPKTVLDRLTQRIRAFDVQHRLVLARERRIA